MPISLKTPQTKVRVHHPLQQGLRREFFLLFSTTFALVRVHHPLQQGLRQTQSSLC